MPMDTGRCCAVRARKAFAADEPMTRSSPSVRSRHGPPYCLRSIRRTSEVSKELRSAWSFRRLAVHRQAARDAERLAGDELGVVAGENQHRAGDVLGLAQAPDGHRAAIG